MGAVMWILRQQSQIGELQHSVLDLRDRLTVLESRAASSNANEQNTRPFGTQKSATQQHTRSKNVLVSETQGELKAAPGYSLDPFLLEVAPDNIIPPVIDTKDVKHGIYGGKGDPKHLGGFTKNDTDGQSPALWSWMLRELNIRSFVDVACGRGISTKWFLDYGTDVLCVEGSADALKQSLLPRDKIVQHDFSQGPWWPANGRTFDASWAVEFLEHVGRNNMQNYLALFKRSALVFVTHSVWGGWHHVEVHNGWWWKTRMEANGFVYSEALTKMARKISGISSEQGGKGGKWMATHLYYHLLVFINPAVASLPRHQHLIGGGGCYANKADATIECEGVDELKGLFHGKDNQGHPRWGKFAEEMRKTLDKEYD